MHVDTSSQLFRLHSAIPDGSRLKLVYRSDKADINGQQKHLESADLEPRRIRSRVRIQILDLDDFQDLV